MFDDCFVPNYVAVALRNAGFNEPCMAIHVYYDDDSGQVQSNLLIHYSNHPPDPDLFNDRIKAAIRKHPNIFREAKSNSELSLFRYAAPLYWQVRRWLFTKGLRIHDCYIAEQVYKKGSNGAWTYTIFDTKTGDAVYPPIYIRLRTHVDRDGNLSSALEQQEGYTEFATEREAWNDAILNALKLLSNDKMDV